MVVTAGPARRRRWWLAVVMALLGGFAGWFMSSSAERAPVVSSAEIVVVGRIAAYEDSILTANQYIEGRMSTFVVIAASDVVREDAERRAGAPRDALIGAITTMNPLGTTALVVQVQGAHPDEAQRRSQAAVDALVDRIGQLENSSGSQQVTLNVVSPPSLPDAPAVPSMALTIPVGVLLGAAVGVALVAGLRALRRAADVRWGNLESTFEPSEGESHPAGEMRHRNGAASD